MSLAPASAVENLLKVVCDQAGIAVEGEPKIAAYGLRISCYSYLSAHGVVLDKNKMLIVRSLKST